MFTLLDPKARHANKPPSTILCEVDWTGGSSNNTIIESDKIQGQHLGKQGNLINTTDPMTSTDIQDVINHPTWKDSIFRQREELARMLREPLSQLAKQCILAWDNREKLNKVLEKGFSGIPYCCYLYVIDNNGIQLSDNVIDTGIMPGYFQINRSDRPYMKEVMPTWGFLLSDAYISMVKHRPSLTAVQVIVSKQVLNWAMLEQISIFVDYLSHHRCTRNPAYGNKSRVTLQYEVACSIKPGQKAQWIRIFIMSFLYWRSFSLRMVCFNARFTSPAARLRSGP